MTDLDREELRSDLEERRQMAEEAFQRIYFEFKQSYPGMEWHTGRTADWATIASEMGISDYYRKLKEGK